MLLTIPKGTGRLPNQPQLTRIWQTMPPTFTFLAEPVSPMLAVPACSCDLRLITLIGTIDPKYKRITGPDMIV